MAYEYKILEMHKVASLNGQTDVAVQVTLQCKNTETGRSSVQTFALNVDNVGSDSTFTAYNNLTEATVISWITEGDYSDEIAAMKSQTENPTISVEQPDPLPWASAT